MLPAPGRFPIARLLLGRIASMQHPRFVHSFELGLIVLCRSVVVSASGCWFSGFEGFADPKTFGAAGGRGPFKTAFAVQASLVCSVTLLLVLSPRRLSSGSFREGPQVATTPQDRLRRRLDQTESPKYQKPTGGRCLGSFFLAQAFLPLEVCLRV